jgi:uncharacterized protein YecE (DUF72 family)
MAGDVRIGISGWRYGPWRGTFYPEDLPQKRELEYASRQVNSIEVNGSFYSLQTPGSYRAWYDATPADFVFSVKGGRYITHLRRLRDVEQPLANFLASGVLALREKLGPILWQFPPNFALDIERFEAFFEVLPRDTASAARLARRHDEKLKHLAFTRVEENRPLRHAVEVRHESFYDAAFVKLLRKHDVALVVADTAGKWPFMEDVTASDFVYVRLHGDEQLYVSGYTGEALDRWAAKVRAWRAGRDPGDAQIVGPKMKSRRKPRDVYVYFDNDVKVRAPVDARGLAHRLGLDWAAPQAGAQTSSRTVHEEARAHWPPIRRVRKSGGVAG